MTASLAVIAFTLLSFAGGALAGDTRTNERGTNAPPPALARVEEPFVRVDPKLALGNTAARVAIVEFGDYQCPYCRGFHVRTLPELQKRYIDAGKVRYFYKDFPLSMHKQAAPAAAAARCAGAQDRYWQMQEMLYAEQARLASELYEELAVELGLNIERFKTCLQSAAIRRAIRNDFVEGRRIGVSGTPSFVLGYVEGDRVIIKRQATGAPALEVFVREIEALLAP